VLNYVIEMAFVQYISTPVLSGERSGVVQCTEFSSGTKSDLSVGSVAQWLERWSLTGELSLTSARSVADV